MKISCSRSQSSQNSQRRLRPQRSVRQWGRRSVSANHRRGSTLLIVLTLMGLLALLGVLFYTFAAQERATAGTFSQEARISTAPSLEPDSLMDFALEQLILGPDDSRVNSALWGGRHSLVPNMLGRDGIPFNGEGTNVRMDTNGNPDIDQNYDETSDGTGRLFLNDSPAANSGSPFNSFTPRNTTLTSRLPEPDVNYTYPDFNHPFLAFRTTLPNLNDSSGHPIPVIIPSFHRPGVLRSSGIMPGQWFNSTSLSNLQFRANPGHLFNSPSGSGASRYATTTAQATTLGLRNPFPFRPEDAQRDGSFGDQGVWSLWSWRASQNIPVGTWTRPSPPNGFYYVAAQMTMSAATNGDTGASQPMWPTTPGNTVTDNEVIWTCAESLPYEYDMDLDGDGLRESVLVDLDFPPQRRGDGKLVVPMFGFYITDADGLIDLNSAGNVGINPFPTDITMSQFGNGVDLSRSNAGVTASEINPLTGLYADPAPAGTDFDQITGTPLTMHRKFLEMLGATSGTNPRSLQELRNLEGFFLLVGSPGFATGSTPSADSILAVTPGRLGEGSQLVSAIRGALMSSPWSFPGPGSAQVDDNGNQSLMRSPAFGWPFDYRGVGNAHNLTTGFGKQLNVVTNTSVAGAGPNRWLQFNQYHANGDVSWQTSTYGSNLMTNTFNQLNDESLESLSAVLDTSVAKYIQTLSSGSQPRLAIDNDDLFSSAETAFLQLSPADGGRLSVGSRLAKLAPANFIGSARAWDIRRQYTTVGGDRREVGKWTAATVTNSSVRAWEPAFSPTFRTALQWMFNNQPTSSDPFRLQRWKLNAHQILVDNTDNPFSTATPTTLKFRELTDHPTTLGNTAITTYAYPPSSPEAYEYWARRDRQALARDIYTLLYLFGGDDNVNYSTADNSGFGVHSAETLRQMAQFAVNYVDSLDADNVISRFEYDTDLGDGTWDMDDNPYTTSESGRAEVWGVEAQQLTLGEFLAVHAPKNDQPSGTAVDDTKTEWDDANDNYSVYVELQNASPQQVTLNSNWQVMIWPRGADDSDPLQRQAARQLILRSGAGNVAAGARYLIGGDSLDAASSASGMVEPSTFLVDTSGGSNPVAQIPSTGSLNLDLVIDQAAGKFYILDGDNTDLTGTVGSYLNQANADPASTSTASSTIPLVVSLRRRAHLTRTSPTLPMTNAAEEDDNPWIEVDRLQIANIGGVGGGMQRLDRNQASTASDYVTAIRSLTSAASLHPFDVQAPQATPTIGNYSHSIGMPNPQNSGTPTPVGTVSQFHFDRPFQSLAELFEIPTEGHRTFAANGTLLHPLRSAVSYAKLSGDQQISLTTTKAVTFGGHITASPNEDFNGNNTLDASEDFNGNGNLDGDTAPSRWYRLLNFLELPGGTNRTTVMDAYSNTNYGTPTNFGWPKESGLLNINTVRQHTVLGAVLDDNTALAVTAPQTFQTQFLQTRDTSDGGLIDWFQDPSGGTSGPRDWWKEYLLARDTFNGTTVDPVSSLVLPGLGNSRPFRGLDFTARGGLSREDTFLRRLPGDHTQSDPRLLFELGTRTEHVDSNPTTALDSYARYRLYQKLSNRTTTRSNTFMVYVGVQFHEAVLDTSGGSPAVRIGGRLEDTPIHRGFFVVDRSGAVDQVKRLMTAAGGGRTTDEDVDQDGALDPGEDRNSNGMLDSAHDTAVGILKPKTLPTPVDFYSYRALSASGANDGIDWRSLILHRQLLN